MNYKQRELKKKALEELRKANGTNNPPKRTSKYKNKSIGSIDEFIQLEKKRGYK